MSRLHLLGFGTILIAILGRPFSKVQMIIGILHSLTSWAIVGYIWAIAWGILLFFKSKLAAQPQAPAAAKAYDVDRIGGPPPANPFENNGGNPYP